MSRMHLTRPCEYLCQNGEICGRRCYTGTCNRHRQRKNTLRPCLECGKGTASRTQYCPCSHKQVYINLKRNKQEKAMNDFIDSLLCFLSD